MSIKQKEKFIVAEVSKNWTADTPATDILCQRFELVINTNNARGYVLKDWKILTVVHGDVFNETIIAIFELKENEIIPSNPPQP